MKRKEPQQTLRLFFILRIMDAKIFFIGGASGAGKSTVARKLSQRFSMAAIELDDFQRLIMPAISDLEPRCRATRNLAVAVIQQLLSAEVTCIVEGAWLEPEQAGELRLETQGRFFPVFCGYHGLDLEARYEAVKNHGRHWTSKEPEARARLFLEKQVADSQELHKFCGRKPKSAKAV